MVSIQRQIIEDARKLAAQATLGKYSIWLTLHDRNGTRLGVERLRGLYPEQVLANITVNVGGPVDLRIRRRSNTPILFIRGRFGGDFREALVAVARVASAVDVHACVFDATNYASDIVTKGITK